MTRYGANRSGRPSKPFGYLDAIRQFGPEKGMEVAEFAVSRRDEGAVAYGIGGDEVRGPAQWFRDVFAYARDGGLHLVCHAGETAGPESIWAALAIGAERIGHGIAAVEGSGVDGAACGRTTCRSKSASRATFAQARWRRWTCIPFASCIDAGVPITIHTDDPAFFHTTLTREYELAQNMFGLPAEEMAANSFRYAFRL